MTNSDDAERRSRLLGVKLKALAATRLDGSAEPAPSTFPVGAALTAGDQAWILLDARPHSSPDRRLGAALAWTLRAGASSLDLVTDVADVASGVLARRAGEFQLPIRVWTVTGGGRELAAAAPEPLGPPATPADDHLELRELIAAGGATPLVEHDVVLGEVRGLEVCRVVDDPAAGVRLEVGVGAHDREAFQMLHGDVPTVESLSRIVDAVTAHRRSGADQHPLNRIARERFLRWQLEQQPDRVAAASLSPAAPPVPRPNVKDAVPCVATGVGVDGRPVTVVCSNGVDLDLVPFVADVRLSPDLTGGDGEAPRRLVVALPERDRLPILDDLVSLLRPNPSWDPVEIVTVGRGDGIGH